MSTSIGTAEGAENIFKHKEMKFVVIICEDRSLLLATGQCRKGSHSILHKEIFNRCVQYMKLAQPNKKIIGTRGGGRIEIDDENKKITFYDASGAYGRYNLKDVLPLAKAAMAEEGYGDYELITKDFKDLDLREEAARVLRSGPTRVMVNQKESTTAELAKRDCGITSDIIYLRDDGWTLGAPFGLVAAARACWESKWVAVMRTVPGEFEPL